MRSRTDECFSRWNRHQPLLHELLTIIFAQSLLSGDVIEAGAHTGSDACFFARLDGARTVYAFEPMQRNVDVVKRNFYHIRNLHLVRGALGSRARIISEDLVHASHNRLVNIQDVIDTKTTLSRRFHVERIDDVFRDKVLAFAHIDVEGAELDVLRGANDTIVRCRPVFTVNVAAMRRHRHAIKILELAARYNYDAYFVPERAGDQEDVRSILFFPKERKKPPLLLAKCIRVGPPNFDMRNARRLLRLTAYFRNVGH